jgi:hypothetical protein
MKLTDEQKAVVSRWISEGATLADVQRRLKDEHGLGLTYMDVRFLVDDLQLQLKEQPKQSEAVDRLAAAKQEGESERQGGGAPTGGVRVTMDAVTRASALASGKVTFSDGETADWMLDQTGRLGLNPTKTGYRPSESDIMAFQQELQRVAQGFA